MSQNATTTSSALRVPVEQLRQELNARFPERREVIDGALCAVLAGEHVLLLGPPGTAKSALVRSIARAFGAATSSGSSRSSRLPRSCSAR